MHAMVGWEERLVSDEEDHEIFGVLRRSRRDVVPVIGAGLSVAAGGAGSTDLLAALVATGLVDDAVHDADLYRVADMLEARKDRSFVQAVVAKAVLARAVNVTPELLALALCPSQLIVTTNYDNAVEEAVRLQEMTPASFGVDQIDLALRQRDPGLVHVLHLHGSADDPSSIVLTKSSYEDAQNDERLALALRELASQHLLVFLGQSLGLGETDIRMHLSWVTEQFQRRSTHLLIEGAGDAPVSDEVVEAGVNLRRIRFSDPSRRRRFVTRAACAIGGPPSVGLDEELPTIRQLVDVYIPVPIAPAQEVESDTARSVWLYGSFFGKPVTYPDDLATEARLLITGGPGFGKTQALLRMASRSDRPSLYMKVGSVRPILDGQDPGSLFLNWAESAEAGHGGVTRLTADALNEQVWDFYLDGLDEVPSDLRLDVATSIDAVADAFPQHRWVLASRRSTNFQDLGLTRFTHYDLVPTRNWVFELGRHYGLQPEQVDAVLDQLPGVGALVEIPFYGAAVVAAVVRGDELPDSPLDLGLYLADRGFDREEPKLLQPEAEVRTWLNRLAFAMEVMGEASIDRHRLSEDLVDLDRIVERTLLVDAAGTVRFPANVVQEARAARVLLDHPGGEEMMVRVAVQEIDGRSYIRPSWRHTIDLLLASTPDPSWRKRISAVDPLAAARSASSTAGTSERIGAAAAIWDWYDTSGLHLPARLDGQLRDDLEAFELLAKDGLDAALRSRIVSALSDDDPPRRGNAIVALAAAGELDELKGRLKAFVADVDPIVRRRAAEAAVKAEMHSLAISLADQAAMDPDELARRTLASAAVRLAAPDKVAVLDRLPISVRREAAADIGANWSRTEQLAYLAGAEEEDEDWFRSIASSSPPEWSEEDVRVLGSVWSRLEFGGLDQRARDVLLQHPKAALCAKLDRASEPYDLFELRFLLDELGDADLDEVTNATADAARQLIADYRALRSLPPGAPTHMSTSKVTRPSLKELVDIGNDDELLHHGARRSEIDELDPDDLDDLTHRVESLWAEERDAGRSPALAIKRTPTGWTCPTKAWQLINWGEELRLPLQREEWLAIASAGVPSSGGGWLRALWQPDYGAQTADRITGCEPVELRGLILAVPDPWPSAVADAATRRFGSSVDPEVKEAIVRALVAGGHRPLVRELASSQPTDLLDAALIELGDCDAEARLLGKHVQEGSPIPDQFDARGHWLPHVACDSSAPFLIAAVHDHLARGTELHELRFHLAALERVMGAKTVEQYDAIINDPAFADGRWLWFNLRQFVDRFGEQAARSRLPTTMAGVLALLHTA